MKRVFLWSFALLAVTAVAVVLAFRLSPWPSVFLINRTIASGEAGLQDDWLVHHADQLHIDPDFSVLGGPGKPPPLRRTRPPRPSAGAPPWFKRKAT